MDVRRPRAHTAFLTTAQDVLRRFELMGSFLVHALTDNDSGMRRDAALALGRVGPAGLDALVNALTSRRPRKPERPSLMRET